ncbi:NAD-dependent epimerase/dehydratase family protein [Moraxella osloensis]|uniref:NAD-dependent epimerase/dehydratase family protein n=1 Tax=Faucicola osloensis TaxID=34062 RepID=A0A6P1KBP7_FAUOS|nr:NAD-dependent epimerase/dehydratase family protein [Moraxella osloensis]QHG08691.1 NAD-dependent epimerase/dehydratase family protein [Moraxella osloensis]
MMQTILMIGLGKIGLPVAKQLAAQGHYVIGVSRSTPTDSAFCSPVTAKLPPDNDNLYQKNLHFVASDARALIIAQLSQWTSQISQICIIVSPDTLSLQGYRDSYYAIAEHVVRLGDQLPNLKRVVFISSTGVYGQNAGEVIDINTPVFAPASATSQVILQTEQLLQQHFEDKSVIIRPSGIYGQSRLRLLTMATQLAAQSPNMTSDYPSNTWTNRIMDIDLVSIIVKVTNTGETVPVYLATDNAPVPLYTVLNYLATAQGLNLSLPCMEPTTGKRIINNLPTTWLNYPDWQSGYQHILSALGE